MDKTTTTTTTTTTTLEALMAEYVAQLSPSEAQVLAIAKDHLESSFHLDKTIGFTQWVKKRQTKIAE